MSAPIKFYVDLMSQPARALQIIFKLSNIPFETCPVALRKGEHLTEKYRNEVNRFQKLPCINDNGFKLAESIAILRYLDNKEQIRRDLFPTDVQQRARVDEFLAWQHLGVRLGCGMYFRTKYLMPFVTGKPPNDKSVAEWERVMFDNLDIMERIWLKSSKFVTGDDLTVADIFGACEIEQTKVAGFDASTKYPKIKQWLEHVRSATNPHYDEAHVFINKIVEKAARSKL